MAQTTGGMPFRVAQVELGASGVAPTNISGQGVGVGTSGGDRSTGEISTFDGDTPIVKAGKRASIDVTCRFAYSESATEAFEVARAIYETAGGAAMIRWQPEASGFIFTGTGIMTSFKYPEGEAAPGEVVLGEFTVKVPEVHKA